MPAYEYAFTLTPGRSSRARSLTIACAAIAAVCVLSSTVVMRELVGAQPARAATATAAAPAAMVPVAAPAATVPAAAPAATITTARAWALEPRWWPGEIRQIVRSAATVPDSDLTFAKGYQLRLAARQAGQPEAQPATLPAQVATTVPSVDTKPSRPVAAVRKATTVAHTETPEIRRVSATRVDGPADPFARFDVGTRALAFDEQRPRERGLAEIRRTPPKGLFGTLY
jgi:hypothetical protein